MNSLVSTVEKFASGNDLGAFDCGGPAYNTWFLAHASASVHAGVSAVYLLIESDGEGLVGFYTRNGFTPTGRDGDLSHFVKVSTIRKALLS